MKAMRTLCVVALLHEVFRTCSELILEVADTRGRRKSLRLRSDIAGPAGPAASQGSRIVLPDLIGGFGPSPVF